MAWWDVAGRRWLRGTVTGSTATSVGLSYAVKGAGWGEAHLLPGRFLRAPDDADVLADWEPEGYGRLRRA